MRIPEPLQVGRHARCARATDEQVASILCIERFEVGVAALVACIVGQLHVGGLAVRVFGHVSQREGESCIVSPIVGHVLGALGSVDSLDGVAQVIGSHLCIGRAIGHGMLVKSVVAGVVDDVQDGFVGTFHRKGSVGGHHMSTFGLDMQHGAGVYHIVGIARRMSRQGKLFARGPDLVRHQAGKGQVAVDGTLLVGTDADGNEAAGVRGEIVAVVVYAAPTVLVAADSIVYVEFPTIVAHGSTAQVADVECGQREVSGGSWSLHVALQ